MTNVSYEEQRLQNIRDNEALLVSLGLSVPMAKPKPKPKKQATTASRKRPLDNDTFKNDEAPPSDDDEEEENPPRRSIRPPKAPRTSKASQPVTPVRRSTRVSLSRTSGSGNGTPIKHIKLDDDYDSDEEDKAYKSSYASGNGTPQRKAQKLGVRTEDPKQFGPIPCVEVGTWWPSRMDCSTAAVHAPTVAGISGHAELGAWSVALSGGYPDDIDLGSAFTYTGSGGRALKGTASAPKNLRTAPQSSNQSFEHTYNAALKKSAETRKPVRVIRGFKLQSKYAPLEGYRYDGLYIVERAWMARGLEGYMVCKYAFKRVPGQPPLPEQNQTNEEEEETDEVGIEEQPEDKIAAEEEAEIVTEVKTRPRRSLRG